MSTVARMSAILALDISDFEKKSRMASAMARAAGRDLSSKFSEGAGGAEGLLGGGGSLAQAGKLLKGGGALIGFTLITNQVTKMSDAINEAGGAFARGEVGVNGYRLKIIESIPLVGQLTKAMLSVSNALQGTAADAARGATMQDRYATSLARVLDLDKQIAGARFAANVAGLGGPAAERAKIEEDLRLKKEELNGRMGVAQAALDKALSSPLTSKTSDATARSAFAVERDKINELQVLAAAEAQKKIAAVNKKAADEKLKGQLEAEQNLIDAAAENGKARMDADQEQFDRLAERVGNLWEGAKTKAEKYREEIEEINRLQQEGVFTLEEADKVRAAAFKEIGADRIRGEIEAKQEMTEDLRGRRQDLGEQLRERKRLLKDSSEAPGLAQLGTQAAAQAELRFQSNTKDEIVEELEKQTKQATDDLKTVTEEIRGMRDDLKKLLGNDGGTF